MPMRLSKILKNESIENKIVIDSEKKFNTGQTENNFNPIHNKTLDCLKILKEESREETLIALTTASSVVAV
jgi:hypothetical protein